MTLNHTSTTTAPAGVPLIRAPTLGSMGPPRKGSPNHDATFFERDGGVWRQTDDGTATCVVGATIEAAFSAPAADGTRRQTFFRFKDRDGHTREIGLRDEWLDADPRKAIARLSDASCPLEGSPADIIALLRSMRRHLPSHARGVVVPRPGFHTTLGAPGSPEVTGFVNAEGESMYAEGVRGPTLVLEASSPRGVLTAGTLDGQKLVIEAAVRSGADHLALAPFMGVVGAIVNLMDEPASPIYAVFGPSTSGKSTALAVAASMSSPPKGSFSRFQSLNTTTNAIEVGLLAGTGSFYGGDETGLFKGDMEQTTFQISEGAGKARLTVDGEKKPVGAWQTGVGLTMEVSPAELMKTEGGRSVRAGAHVRVACIDTTGTPTLPEVVIQAIKQCRFHYGHVHRLFVQHLLDLTSTNPSVATDLRGEVDARVAALTGGEASGLRKRAARPFALLGVVGRLLREIEVTPADYDADALITRVWARYAQSEAAPVDPTEAAVAELLARLPLESGAGLANLADPHERRTRAAMGYFDIDHGTGAITYYIPGDGLTKLSGGNVSRLSLAQALRDRGVLIPARGRNLTHDKIAGVGPLRHYRLRVETPREGQGLQEGSEQSAGGVIVLGERRRRLLS